MKTPARTPEGEPRRCPLCGAAAAVEPSPGHCDATCPRCGALLSSEARDARPRARRATVIEEFARLLAGDEAVDAEVGGDGRTPAPRIPPEVVETCFGGLPPHYREVIVLRHREQRTWSEVAGRLGMSSDSAPRGLHRQALLALAELLRRRRGQASR
jgi:DNA-directed RNA polymerase specialized sigma24 family protein